MTKQEVEEWLTKTVEDSFMDIFYYDRKEDEEMDRCKIQELLEDGTLDKDMMTRVFLKQIEEEFE